MNLKKKISRNIFLFLSVIIHLLIFIFAFILSDLDFKFKKPLQYIEITEIIQDSNEIDNDASSFVCGIGRGFRPSIVLTYFSISFLIKSIGLVIFLEIK